MPSVRQLSRAWVRKLVDDLAREAEGVARPLIPHNALREGFYVVRQSHFRAYLIIPHYWAIYIHDGRGPFGPRRAKALVWFTDPSLDPRLRPRYPVRYRDVKRLTKAQYYAGLQANARLRASGLGPVMIVRRFQPKPLAPTPFFSKGMKPFETRARKKIQSRFQRLVDAIVAPTQEEDTVRVLLDR